MASRQFASRDLPGSQRTFDQVVTAIENRSRWDPREADTLSKARESAKRGVRRATLLLEQIGSPHLNTHFVHVAGSKGKGSTCAYTSSLLVSKGYRTGLLTSPHIHTLQERIIINGDIISTHDFADVGTEVFRAIAQLERQYPSVGKFMRFEIIMAMGLLHCVQSKCDVVVLEVGTGGRYDPTNIVTPEVSMITLLELEHTKLLGASLTEIAFHKGGIIKPRKPVIIAPQPWEALRLLLDIARLNQSEAWIVSEQVTFSGHWSDFSVVGPWGVLDSLRAGIRGRHQRENVASAIIASWLYDRDVNSLSQNEVRDAISHTQLPGRFEIFQIGGRTLILDVAHTPTSVSTLADSLEEEFPGRQIIVIIGLLRFWDPSSLTAPLRDKCSHWVATQVDNRRTMKADTLQSALQQLGYEATMACDVRAALDYVESLAPEDAIVVIMGSFATIGEARALLLGIDPVPSLRM